MTDVSCSADGYTVGPREEPLDVVTYDAQGRILDETAIWASEETDTFDVPGLYRVEVGETECVVAMPTELPFTGISSGAAWVGVGLLFWGLILLFVYVLMKSTKDREEAARRTHASRRSDR